jgi:uncharacterized membrane protein YbhN (UPF0104 family)
VTALSGHRRRLALGGLLAFALLFLFFRNFEWDALGAAFRRANPLWLAAMVGCTLIVYAVRAWRWGFLLAPLARVPFRDLFSITMVGFASGLVLPRAGEILRPYLVGRRHAIRTSAAFATIIVERLVDLVTVLFLFALYLYVLPVPAAETRGSLLHARLPLLGLVSVGRGPTGVAILALLAAVVAFLVASKRLVGWGVLVLGWLPGRLARPLVHVLESFGDGLAVLKAPPRALAAIFAQSLVIWLAIAASFQLNHMAFGIHLPFHATFLLIACLTIGVAIPTPGMVGGFHVAYLIAMTNAYGIDTATAGAAGLAAHALTNLPVLILGLFFVRREGLTFGAMAQMTDSSSPDPAADGAPPNSAKEEQP